MTPSGLANMALWSYALAAAGFAAFGLRLMLGWRASLRSNLLLGAILMTVLWSVGQVVAVYAVSPPAWIASIVCDALRYALWFAFLMSLLQPKVATGLPARTFDVLPRWVVTLVTAGLLASMLFPPDFPLLPDDDPAGRSQTYGLRIGLAIIGLILVEQLLRRAGAQARWAVKPLCVALAGVFAFDLFFFADAMLFGRLDENIWMARGVANLLVIPFIAIAAARNSGWTIEMHLSRSAVFHSTAILLSGVFLLAVALAGYFVRYFGGEWGKAVQIEIVFAALVFAALVASSGSFRSKLRVFVSKHFFSYRYDYREEWLRFTRTLSTENSLHGVQESCIRALADLVESPAGALWLKQENGAFRQVSWWNMPAVDVLEPATGSLPAFLERTGWVIDLTHHASEPGDYRDLALPSWLASLPAAWLIVPLLSASELVGFVILATPRAAIEVNWEVRDLLKTASRQAASYLGHIRASEALIEARKFDAFNRMSSFVVHDLKNLVAQLSLMLRNADRHRANPEFQRDMLMTIEHVVERMNGLMLQLRMGTSPVEKPRPADLEAIVRRVCRVKSSDNAPIGLDLSSGLAVVGHEDRLEHVVGHLVQNAIDATSDAGDVSIGLAREGAMAVLEVRDTGVGMTPEFVRDRLFKPFETSKPAGMGIGVYESAQYVTSIGGKILVDSAPGAGTRVRLLLPAADAAFASAIAPELPA